jgi:predicted CxxxxCH...CXXCH cytochrome family protein
MKTLIKIVAAGMLLAAFNCTQKSSGPEPLVITAANCGSCHAVPPADSGHAYHIGMIGYSCSHCHQGYVWSYADSAAGTFSVNAALHRNGDTNVVFSAPWNGDSAKAAFVHATKQCNNVYCHGAIPQGTHASIHWNGTDKVNGNCRSCHNVDGPSGIYSGHYGHTKDGVSVGTVMTRGANVQLCFNCHGENISDTAYSVGLGRVDGLHHINGVFEGSCRDCHTPDWTTWEEYLLTHQGATPFGKIRIN